MHMQTLLSFANAYPFPAWHLPSDIDSTRTENLNIFEQSKTHILVIQNTHDPPLILAQFFFRHYSTFHSHLVKLSPIRIILKEMGEKRQKQGSGGSEVFQLHQ
jgi:hypothetical protein